jgi:hydrogenase maturation protease
MSDGRTRTLVIGCGNLLRGDDAAGPVLVRRLWERGLRAGVECADGGTGGMDVAFQMRGCDHVILVDACRRVVGEEAVEEAVEQRDAGFGGGTSLVAVDLADSAQMLLELAPTPSPPVRSPAAGAGFGGGTSLVAVDLADSVQMLLELAPTPSPPVRSPAAGAGFGGGNCLVAVGRGGPMLLEQSPTPSPPVSVMYEVPGEEVENLPPLEGINLHAFRWDHAIAFGRWLLKEEYPEKVTAFLIEAEAFEPGAPLSPAVDRAVDELVELLAVRLELPPEEPARAAARRRDRLRPEVAPRDPLHRAELLTQLGEALQELGSDGSRGPLLEAVKCHQQALQLGVTAETHPAWFARLQNDLGLAYLSMPAREAGDQLRVGIAAQAFRWAAEALDRNREPGLWASVTMNLANALQYLPSSHPEENLARAVAAYDDVLAVRTTSRDPVGHARALLNQANALAHLGRLNAAAANLAAAAPIFAAHGCAEELAAVEELTGQIHDAEAIS